MTAIDVDDILSMTEVCKLTGRARVTVQRWVTSGRLVPIKQLPGTKGSYLFSRADVLAAVASEEPA